MLDNQWRTLCKRGRFPHIASGCRLQYQRPTVQDIMADGFRDAVETAFDIAEATIANARNLARIALAHPRPLGDS